MLSWESSPVARAGLCNNVVCEASSHLDSHNARQRLACVGSPFNGNPKGAGIFDHSNQQSSGHRERWARLLKYSVRRWSGVILSTIPIIITTFWRCSSEYIFSALDFIVNVTGNTSARPFFLFAVLLTPELDHLRSHWILDMSWLHLNQLHKYR